MATAAARGSFETIIDLMVLPPDDPRMTTVRLRRELVAAGWNDRALSAALRSGDLARPRRGAYVDGPVWLSMSSDDRYAVRCRAAQRQASTPVALSHTSVLPFVGSPLWGLDLDEVHLCRLDGRTGRREAGVRQHCGVLLGDDLVEGSEPLVVSATRAAIEVTTVAALEPALCVVNDLLHRGLTTIAALRSRYESGMQFWPDSLRTDLVLRRADARIESIGETRFDCFMTRHHLPPREPQWEVFLPNGVLLAALDFAVPSHGVWFEFDGAQKYVKHLRKGESVADAVLREKRREDRVREVTGWECMRITWWDLEHPQQLLVRIKAFLASASARRSSAG